MFDFCVDGGCLPIITDAMGMGTDGAGICVLSICAMGTECVVESKC